MKTDHIKISKDKIECNICLKFIPLELPIRIIDLKNKVHAFAVNHK
jgi:hypothetical protein